jgi:hypothetical protein
MYKCTADLTFIPTKENLETNWIEDEWEKMDKHQYVVDDALTRNETFQRK